MIDKEKINTASAHISLPSLKMTGRCSHILTGALTASKNLPDVMALIARIDSMALQSTDEQTAEDLRNCADLLYVNTILYGVKDAVNEFQDGSEEAAKRAFLCEYWGQQTIYSRQYDVEQTCFRLNWQKKVNVRGNIIYEYKYKKTIAESTLIRPLAEGCDMRLGIERKKNARRPAP
ncbi:MAG: hypothetical protein COB41_05170 [Proteobacteria bacterium]|nr:MAG: hypothetical protein COB41_05170 [Pseudomonadota bacterium]